MSVDYQTVLKILDVASAYDVRDWLFWNTRGECAPVSFFIICNDLFAWGTADLEPLTAETIPEWEQALKDAKAADGYGYNGCELYCARRRKMRPQGACYKDIPQSAWSLFDACGPERVVGSGNPYKQPAPTESA